MLLTNILQCDHSSTSVQFVIFNKCILDSGLYTTFVCILRFMGKTLQNNYYDTKFDSCIETEWKENCPQCTYCNRKGSLIGVLPSWAGGGMMCTVKKAREGRCCSAVSYCPFQLLVLLYFHIVCICKTVTAQITQLSPNALFVHLPYVPHSILFLFSS